MIGENFAVNYNIFVQQQCKKHFRKTNNRHYFRKLKVKKEKSAIFRN